MKRTAFVLLVKVQSKDIGLRKTKMGKSLPRRKKKQEKVTEKSWPEVLGEKEKEDRAGPDVVEFWTYVENL